MPANYHDPTAAVPVAPRADRRPPVHTLEVSRDAVDVIAAADRHIHALGHFYGRDSDMYLDALESWHRHLSQLFALGFGARTASAVTATCPCSRTPKAAWSRRSSSTATNAAAPTPPATR